MLSNHECFLVGITHRFVCSEAAEFERLADQLATHVPVESGSCLATCDLTEQTFTIYTKVPGAAGKATAVTAAWRRDHAVIRHFRSETGARHWGITQVDVIPPEAENHSDRLCRDRTVS